MSKLSIGYACICIGDYHRFKSIRLKNADKESLEKIYRHNLYVLKEYIKYNIKHDILLFRISSDIFPLITREDIYFNWEKVFKDELEEIKELIDSNNMRVSMHPGQYTVLSSENSDVRKRAIDDVEFHSDFLDHVTDNKETVIIIHLGGKYGDANKALDRFYNSYKKLSNSAKEKLCIENDERMYTAKEVYEFGSVYSIPCIFDNLHNMLNPSYDLSDKEIINMFSHTFINKKQKIHFSLQDINKKKGAHSITINPKIFVEYYNKLGRTKPDIMLEVKDKDLSAIKVTNYLSNKKSRFTQEWARYKYFVMSKNYNMYKEISNVFNNDSFDKKSFYEKIDKSIKANWDNENVINAIMHIWGYFKKYATEKEKDRYLSYIDKLKKSKVKKETVDKFLLKLAIKYNEQYLLESIYFNNVY